MHHFPEKLLFLALSSALVFTLNFASADDGKFLGVGSCSSSNCHGASSPRKGNNILQNEYVTWLKHDHHAKAYQTLLGDEARIMAKHLGFKAPEKEAKCLTCHSTLVTDNRKGPKFQAEDGVGCESCHGASEKWLDSHAESGETHAENVANGMIELASLNKRTSLCLNCHLGSSDRIDHSIYGAGHPRLTFELDTFEAIMPRHWAFDEDYPKRKGAYAALSAWYVGQAERSLSLLKNLSAGKGHEGLADFSQFSCYSCHHPLSKKQYKERDYQGNPGRPPYDLSSLKILGKTVGALDPDSGAAIFEKSNALLRVSSAEELSAGASELTTLVSTKALGLKDKLASDKSLYKGIVKNLLEYCATGQVYYFDDAEQIAMGVSAAVVEQADAAKKYKAGLESMFATLKDPDSYSPADFAQSCAQLLK